MFDLFRSRAKAVRYLMTALLLMVALSMVAYLVPGGTGSDAQEQVIAKIGGEQLTAREVQLSIQAALRNKQAPPEMVQHYVPQYIDQMITERALAFQAGRMGFDVTEADTAFVIRSMLPNIFAGGQFNKDVYQMFLQQQNLTIPEFEANVRKQVLMTKLRNLVLEGVVVTPQEVEAEYRRRNEKVKLEYIEFSSDKFRSQVKVSPEEIQDHFNKNRGNYRVNEKRSFDLLVIDEERVAATTNPTDLQVRRAYEDGRDRYRIPERVRVRHILIKTAEKPKEEIPKLEAKANDLLKQIKGGADFAELAKKNSEDPGSAAKGGELDWVARGQTVANFESAAFTLKPKELSGVVKTEYGFHIIQVLEKQEARMRPFEEVKGELAAELKKQMVGERLQTVGDQMRADLVKAPSDAEGIAKKYGAGFYRVEKAGPGDPLQEVGVVREVEEAVFAVDKGAATPLLSANNKLLAAVVREVVPARPAELNEVENQIRSEVESNKAQTVAQQKAKEAAEKIKAGADLKVVAKAMGIEIKIAPEFGRDGAAEGIGQATYLEEAFAKPVGAIVGPVTVTGRIFITRVAGKADADMSKLPEQRETLVTALKGRKARERQELFEDGILTELIREGKVKINQDVINRLVASYRG
jgi:peptidyl-prolyl cis-trans isomerase D